MSDTGFAAFSASVSKTNELLHEIEEAYGWPKERRQQSYAALRSVLHALRDRLTVQEAADFAAQLPMLVRGIYYEGWDPSKVPLKLHREEFLDRVAQAFPYEVDGGMERLVRTVLEVLHRRYVSEGELEDIRSSLPRDLAGVVP
ncbi:MAG: hypothetical protein QOJ13_3278 [Gaiellales bacterium]|jgi:uncharacterized protein (DUF2267 family)|nr:hypothetical protein [Gaiellales bacterium]MDX6594082.1 hypothetical protein [Gaiellales bacterium]